MKTRSHNYQTKFLEFEKKKKNNVGPFVFPEESIEENRIVELYVKDTNIVNSARFFHICWRKLSQTWAPHRQKHDCLIQLD